LRAGPVNPGSVDKHNLRGTLALARGHFYDALNPVPCSLRLVADNRDFLADEGIQQRRLASIGTAEDGNETRAHTLV
jgi:hypothetical protein